MQFKLLHCWDCGTRVIDGPSGGPYSLAANFRQVRFDLSDGSYCESPFCTDCANRPWTSARTAEFRRAASMVSSPLRTLTIRAVRGPSALRVTVLGVTDADRLNNQQGRD